MVIAAGKRTGEVMNPAPANLKYRSLPWDTSICSCLLLSTFAHHSRAPIRTNTLRNHTNTCARESTREQALIHIIRMQVSFRGPHIQPGTYVVQYHFGAAFNSLKLATSRFQPLQVSGLVATSRFQPKPLTLSPKAPPLLHRCFTTFLKDTFIGGKKGSGFRVQGLGFQISVVVYLW